MSAITLAQHSVELGQIRHLEETAEAHRKYAEQINQQGYAKVREAFPLGCMVQNGKGERRIITGHNGSTLYSVSVNDSRVDRHHWHNWKRLLPKEASS